MFKGEGILCLQLLESVEKNYYIGKHGCVEGQGVGREEEGGGNKMRNLGEGTQEFFVLSLTTFL